MSRDRGPLLPLSMVARWSWSTSPAARPHRLGYSCSTTARGLLAKRLEHIPNSDPPRVRIISDNRFYVPYECTSEEINIIGRIRWFAREI